MLRWPTIAVLVLGCSSPSADGFRVVFRLDEAIDLASIASFVAVVDKEKGFPGLESTSVQGISVSPENRDDDTAVEAVLLWPDAHAHTREFAIVLGLTSGEEISISATASGKEGVLGEGAAKAIAREGDQLIVEVHCAGETCAAQSDGGTPDGPEEECEPCEPSGWSWTNEVIDSVALSGVAAASSVAARGCSLHVAYYDNENSSLMHGSRVKGAWENTTVDSMGDVGRRPSIGLGPGVIHIAYEDAILERVKYAVRQGEKAWRTEVIDSSAVGEKPSLCVDPSGTPHIFYARSASEEWQGLAHGVPTELGWVPIQVDGIVPQDIACAADTEGNLHVVSTVGYHTILADAKMGSSFLDLHLGSYDVAGAVDDRGFHVSFLDWDAGTGHTMYGLIAVGSVPWNPQPLEGESGQTSRSALVVDPAGIVHLVYRINVTWPEPDVIYVSRGPEDSEWSDPMPVSDVPMTSDAVSLAMDASGALHVTYFTFTYGQVKHAYYCP